jgi:serine/threonine protein kinase
VRWLSDATLAHLCRVADWPDLGGSRYELVGKIGQGGMGTVFRVQDRELDRPVALKVLHTRVSDPEAAARMMREARVLARLEHPSIVPVHDSGVLPDGRFYYTMKLVRGKRLDECVSASTSLAERLRLLLKICDAMSFAHAHGVLHRDLKPQNIMLGTYGEVLVMDWGIAKERGASERIQGETTNGDSEQPGQTAPGTVVGTPGYMAPEQARGEVSHIDERSDVYALGAILCFLLTGLAPGPLPPRRHDRSIPRPLEAICLKAMASEPGSRYANVAELAGDLGDFLAGRRVRAYPEGPLGAAVRLATNYRTALVLILTYVVVRLLLFLLNP